MPPHSRSGKGRPGRLSAATTLIVVATILILAWGSFAFGAVYAWAYVPLAAASVLVGVAGLLTGDRPVVPGGRVLLISLAGIAGVGLVQLLPLPAAVLAVLSPGTLDYLRRTDLGVAFALQQPSSQVAVSHTISVAPALTVRALGLLLGPALLCFGLCRTLSRTAATRLAIGIVLVGCGLSMLGVGQKALLGDHAFGGMRIYGVWQPESLLTTPFGPFVNKNHFAGWMLMGIPVALGLAAGGVITALPQLRGQGARMFLVWCSEPEGGRTSMYFVAAIFMTLSLFMTGSRSGIAAFAVIIAGLLLAVRRLASRRTLALVGVAVFVAVLVVLQWAGPDAALQRFRSDPQSLGLRIDIWRSSLVAFRQFPWLGSGLDSFGTVMLLFQTGPKDVRYAEAHNEYMQILIEGGLISLALVLVAIGGVAWSVRRRFHSGDDSTESHWVRVGAACGLVAIALQSLVEFSLQMPGNAALCAVLLALALYEPAPVRQPR